MKRLILCALPTMVFFSCSKYFLSASYQKVGRNDLASTYVGSPDPQQAHPPSGQMVILNWCIPGRVLRENPQMVLDVIFRNHTKETFIYPISSRLGYVTYRLVDAEHAEKGGLLTYRVQIVTEGGEIYKQWTHQLWAELISCPS